MPNVLQNVDMGYFGQCTANWIRIFIFIKFFVYFRSEQPSSWYASRWPTPTSPQPVHPSTTYGIPTTWYAAETPACTHTEFPDATFSTCRRTSTATETRRALPVTRSAPDGDWETRVVCRMKKTFVGTRSQFSFTVVVAAETTSS